MPAARAVTTPAADPVGNRRAASILALAAAAWVGVLVATPMALGHGYVTAPALVFHACSLICHQRPERSFHLLGVQLPVCARCFGLYAAGAAGAIGACLSASRRLRGVAEPRVVLAIAALPTAITWICEQVGLWHPGGATRAIAAVPLGLAAGWVLLRSLIAGSAESREARQVRYHS